MEQTEEQAAKIDIFKLRFKKFLEKLTDLLTFMLPNYKREGKAQLIIAIGCTGGQHRSVTVARVLADRLKEAGFNAISQHREIE